MNNSIEPTTSTSTIGNSPVTPKNVGFAIVALLITLFVVNQVWEQIRSSRAQSAAGNLARQMAGDMNDQDMADLYTSSSYAKLAFMDPKVGTDNPDAGSLGNALDAAEDLEYNGTNSPGVARRVILLRILLHKPAFKNITHKGDKRIVKPIDAYTVNLPKILSAKERLGYSAEIQAWIAADTKTKMTAGQMAAAISALSTVPGIGWWKSPSLMVVYRSQGDVRQAHAAFTKAQMDAALSMLPLIFAVPIIICMVLVGVFLLIFLVARTREEAENPEAKFNPWPIQPSVIKDSDRKLSTNLLWGIFILYLSMVYITPVLISGYSGHGHFKWIHVDGLLTSQLGAIERSSTSTHSLIVVLVSAGAYLFAALVPMAVLMRIANAKGASLADELGWHTRNIKRNLMFGVLGYCAGLPLLFLAAEVGTKIFKGAAEPTNPALTIMSNGSSVSAQVIMLALATICAPLLEEFFFRGVFYQGARQKFGPAAAIVMTGAIFGLAHPVGADGMLAIAVLGCVLAWIAESRKSLASSMIGHCLQNVGASMAVILIVSR